MKPLGKRLGLVLTKLIEGISKKQSLCMRKLATSRKEEIQFGRFIGNDRVSVGTLTEELYRRVQASGSCSHCLLIEDSSSLGFSLKRTIEGLGKVDKGQVQGFYVHPVLALDAEHYGCLGVAGLEFINRPWQEQALDRKQANAQRSKTAFEDKESYRWLRSIQQALPQCSHIAKKTVIADREADIYPLLTGLVEELGVDYVIRSRFDRPTQQAGSLLKEISSWGEQGCYQVGVPASDGRSAHQAKLIIKYGPVCLKKSEGKTTRAQPRHLLTWVVEVKEKQESVINHEKPIHWILLSSHPIDDVEKARQVVDYYKQRWTIEQAFRVLKTKGLRVESSQVDSYKKLQKVTLLAFLAAVKVLPLVKAREGQTPQQGACVFDEDQQAYMRILNKHLEGNTEKLKNPFPEDSLAFCAWVMGRLGGWSGYKSQRPPGPIDLLTGLQHFEQLFQGYCLAKIT